MTPLQRMWYYMWSKIDILTSCHQTLEVLTAIIHKIHVKWEKMMLRAATNNIGYS